jgi:hypothetical protein
MSRIDPNFELCTYKPMPMMKCGCVARGTKNGKPVCPTHVLLTPLAEEVMETPDLGNREAKCAYCGLRKPSDVTLPFFVHRPQRETDDFYCGCRGWD